MEYRTIEGVELVAVGMEWHAASGTEAFTFENLADAVEAANNDPHVLAPRIKLGHSSGLNEGESFNPFEALGDAEPAFGRVVNLRLGNDGGVLLGDFIEVPAWLADAMPSAYPNRSIEARRMVETEGGKRYSMVLTAVALLGAVPPACTSLDELERLLVEGPSGVAAASNPNPEEGRMSETVAASVDVNTIRERFNFGWAMDPENGAEMDTYWWWASSVRVDPMEVIADDDEGHLYSVPFETDGKDTITFGEPVRVRPEYVPTEASAETVAAAYRQRVDQKVVASDLARPDKPAPNTAASRPEKEEDTMDAKAIRESLGLAEDATDEQVLAKAAELRGEVEQEPAEVEETDETTETEVEEADAPEPVAASVAPEALAQLQEDAKAGREARAAQLAAERKEIVESAVKAGKFPPSAAASYRAQLDKGGEIEASTRQFIAELAENVVPVDELGVARTETNEAEMSQIMAAFGHKSKQAA